MSRGRRVVVGYARTSGVEERNGHQLEEQIRQIKTFAQRQDLALEQIYYDTGIANEPRSFRAGIFTLLDQLDIYGTTDVVVVRTDRIIREGEIGRQILKELERAKTNIISLTEDPQQVKQDTRRITSTTVAALKSASTKIEALKRGKAPAGRAAYGYRRKIVPGEASTRLVVVEDEVKTVQWIFREYLRRRSMAKVAEGLATHAIPAPGGKAWSRASVAWILGNEIYIGLVKFGSVRGQGEHKPIVSPLLYDKVQELRTSNRRTRRADSPAPSERREADEAETGLDRPTREDVGASSAPSTRSDAATDADRERARLSALDREALEAAERGETVAAPHDHPGKPVAGETSDDFEFEPLPSASNAGTGE